MSESPANSPYTDPQYQQQRKAWFDVIPKSALLSAIGRNAWTITYALTTTAVAAIVMGVIHVPVVGIAVMIGGVLAAAAVNAYASYMDEKMSKTVDLGYRESRQIADARVLAQENAKEMAAVLKDTIGQEIRELREDKEQTKQAMLQTQQALAHTQSAMVHMQKQMTSWQEREEAKEPVEKVLH